MNLNPLIGSSGAVPRRPEKNHYNNGKSELSSIAKIWTKGKSQSFRTLPDEEEGSSLGLLTPLGPSS